VATRAIIQIEDGREKWSIYCHGDGYPEVVGKIVYEAVKEAPKVDPNFRIVKTPKVDFDNPKWYQKYQPNASIEAGKFATFLIGKLWDEYGEAYLTDRDPEREIKEDWTDIEYLYKVRLCGDYDNLKEPEFSWWVPNGEKFVKQSLGKFKEIKGR